MCKVFDILFSEEDSSSDIYSSGVLAHSLDGSPKDKLYRLLRDTR